MCCSSKPAYLHRDPEADSSVQTAREHRAVNRCEERHSPLCARLTGSESRCDCCNIPGPPPTLLLLPPDDSSQPGHPAPPTEIISFLKSRNEEYEQLSDDTWLLDLGFLTDLTAKLNDLNRELQGKDRELGHMISAVEAFK
ncbi:General transcription factor II-I repeat domain containing protein 2, partial [Dissostichus eleginoides]